MEFVIFFAISSYVLQANVSNDWKQLRIETPDLILKSSTNSRIAKVVHTQFFKFIDNIVPPLDKV